MQHPRHNPLNMAGLVLGDFDPARAGHPAYCSPALCTARQTGGAHRSTPTELGSGARLSLVGADGSPAGLELVQLGTVRTWWPQTERQSVRAWRELMRHLTGSTARGAAAGGAR
ncbi:hypothetical protein OHA72_15535 [Dactylosporangium sp. NBC_01737]|uniref:hypothetical protein n=1 Tax=Dactylosporangium sp. NBC_01737 TaxID=2975959 RepID=UPI002E0EDD94|nr:hypothetical protein OHA72_15535 [Dactylosporangium sp. NBC_01737]